MVKMKERTGISYDVKGFWLVGELDRLSSDEDKSLISLQNNRRLSCCGGLEESS